MAKTQTLRILVAEAMKRIGAELNYSQPHIRKIMHRHRGRLQAECIFGRWTIPASSEEILREIVKNTSGVRYKFGHRGPQIRNRQAA